MMKIENHHWANTIVTIIAGKSYIWMLKLVGKNMIRNRILHSFKISPPQILIMKKTKVLPPPKMCPLGY